MTAHAAPARLPRTPFLDRLERDVALTETERSILHGAGVRSYDALLVVAQNFPSLGRQTGVNLAKLSSIAARKSDRRTVNAAQISAGGAGVPRRTGALHPPRSPAPPGFIVPMPSLSKAMSPPLISSTTIDLRPAAWPVRDQGQRGTCVAFAVTACREHAAASETLSEQFAFWAAKRRSADPRPNDDGTWIEFCLEGFENAGVCLDAHWPYSGVVLPDVTHENSPSEPSTTAMADASTRCTSPVHHARGDTTGNVASVLQFLQAGSPVAASLPVFADPIGNMADNWNTALGILYGEVLEPPTTAAVIGGHAVCITGFVADDTEPSGGFFIFRNSWGRNWAAAAPTPGYHSPEQGYGQISATYIEKYLWEMGVL